MPFRNHFPASTWIARALIGRTARQFYSAIIVLLLVVATGARIYSFRLTHRIQRVISGLSKLRIDEATEDEVLRTVPFLTRGGQDWHVQRNNEVGDVDSGVERVYYVTFSNKESWMRFERFAVRFSSVEYSKGRHPKSWILTVAGLLGYRYIGFGASVVLLDGKVSSVRYGIADDLVFPEQIGAVVSVSSVHARWASHQRGFEVPSTDDESPQFNIRGDDEYLAVSYTPDASPALKSHAFQVDLSCFWSLLGCRHARQVSPLLWQDKNAIEAATLARLKSRDPCPDRIVIGRVRYLPDADITLLESTGFKTESANEEGLRVDEIGTHYKLVEVLRGRSSMWWESVRVSATIPYPGDYERTLPNTGLRWANAGEKVLAFSNLSFDSCQVVPATSSALSSVRDTIPAPRRIEDELVTGL